MSRRPFAVVALLAAALAATAAPAQAAPPSGTAADGPGDVSHFDLARKDCVGTARNRRSKVWFTIADGVLSDVYFPTNDNTNVETLQYVVTDGKTTDLQTRDMTYTVKALDDRALGCRVTATAKSGRYRIITDYVTDPARADHRDAQRASRRCKGKRSRLPAVRPLRPDAQRQRRRRRAATPAPTAATSRPTTATRARRLGPGHRHQRGQPRLRDPGLQRARRRPRRSAPSPTASPARRATA